MSKTHEYYAQIINQDIATVARELFNAHITEDVPPGGGTIHISCPHHKSIGGRSLHINTINQKWHCFGCSVGGDILHLVEFAQSGKVTKGLSKGSAMPDTHRAARDWLAKRIGLQPLGATNMGPEQIKRIEAQRSEDERTFACLSAIVAFYHGKMLSHKEQMCALHTQYAITPETVSQLQIGYSDNAGLYDALRAQGFTNIEIASTGMTAFFDQNDIPTFRFDNRFIFPYWKNGTVVYAIARTTRWTPKTNTPKAKYMKLPVQDKHRHKLVSSCIKNDTFYNEDCTLAHPAEVVITEGVTDCIALQQAGFAALSPVTTTFRAADHKKLLQLTSGAGRVYICQDNELSGAGMAGAVKTAQFLLENGVEAKIIVLPLSATQIDARERLADETLNLTGKDKLSALADAKMDVCDYLRTHPAQDFRDLMKMAYSPIMAQIEAIPQDIPEDERVELLRPILKSLCKLDDLSKSTYIKAIQARFKAAGSKINKTELSKTINEFKKEAALGGTDGPTYKEIASAVVENDGPFCYEPGAGFYLYENGVWLLHSTDWINSLILCRLDEDFRGDNTSRSQRDEIRERLANTPGVILRPKAQMNENKNLLNLTNGMFDFESGKLLKHDEKYLSTIQLPYEYNKNASCDRWMQFLEEIFPRDAESHFILQEWFGLSLFPNTTYEKSLFCIGEKAANGKSTTLEILARLVGEANCSHIPLADLDRAFYTIGLRHKLLNICGEVDKTEISGSATFKDIISGAIRSDALKHKDRIDFRVFARLCFATNHLPKFSDTTEGLFRRMIVLKFNQKFYGKNRDRQLIKKLELELSGIFQWAIMGYQRLIERDDFTVHPDEQEYLEEIKINASSVAAYLSESIDVVSVSDTHLYITVNEIYRDYEVFCKQNNYKPYGSCGFGREIRLLLPEHCCGKVKSIDGKSARVVVGVKMR